MKTDQIHPGPMKKSQLDYLKKQIMQTYLHLISHTAYDPKVIEIMKIAALMDVQKRYEAGEPW